MAKIQQVTGLGDSYATFNPTTQEWEVIGAPNVLDDQEDGELAYKINCDQNDWRDFANDVPIYASVYHDNDKPEASTVSDFKASAKQIINDLQNDPDDIPAGYQLKSNLANDQDAIGKLVDTLIDYLTWQHLVSIENEIVTDINEAPDAYPYLLKER